jgi:transportin-3
MVYWSAEHPRDMALVELLYTQLVQMKQNLKNSLDDNAKVRGLCRVFVEAGESYVDLIVTRPALFKEVIESLLICSSYDDLEVVRTTFGFWQTLTDELFHVHEALQEPFFGNVYSQLVDIIIKHLHYPEELEDWTALERDEFREFRHDIGRILKDCVRVLGEESALAKPLHLLNARMAKPASTEWQEIEASLFSLRTMGAEISVTESKVLPQIMMILPQLPQHPKIRYAVILVMGRYAEWTNKHPDFIQYQLQYVSAGFEDKESVAAAAQTLRDLCKYCSQVCYMIYHFYQEPH